MKVGAIFPVGTSVGGAPAAIRKILNQENAVEVHLLYGEPGKPGTRDPKELAEQIRKDTAGPLVSWGLFQMVRAFDFQVAYGEIRQFVSQISQADYGRVYVGATGATNPIVASLFQAAMAYLRAEVIPIYAQKYEEDEQVFIGTEIRDRILAEEALGTARKGQIRGAASLLAVRPTSLGPWRFVSRALTAFAQWDDFDYGPASSTLVQQADKCAALASDDLLGPLSETVARIAAHARDLRYFTEQLDRNKFAAAASTPGWAQRVEDCGMLVVADALANAQRRSIEGRYTDSVLRAYRAAECATQMRLFKLGIHPSAPATYRAAYERCFAGNAESETSTRTIDFNGGLKTLESIHELDRTPINDSVRELQQLRNESYLEHGYRRASQQDAARCFEVSLEICRFLLGPSVDHMWREFEMRF